MYDFNKYEQSPCQSSLSSAIQSKCIFISVFTPCNKRAELERYFSLFVRLNKCIKSANQCMALSNSSDKYI